MVSSLRGVASCSNAAYEEGRGDVEAVNREKGAGDAVHEGSLLVEQRDAGWACVVRGGYRVVEQFLPYGV